MLALLLMNLGFAGGGAPIVAEEPTPDKGQDAGSPWWTGAWIDPHQVYGPLTDLPQTLARLKQRAAGLEDGGLRQRIDALAMEAAALEARAQAVVALAAERVEAAMEAWRVRGFTDDGASTRLAVILGTRDGRAMVTERVSNDRELAVVGGMVVEASSNTRALSDLSEAIANAVRRLMGERTH